MGRIVVADETDVRRIVKEELVNFYNTYFKADTNILAKLMGGLK